MSRPFDWTDLENTLDWVVDQRFAEAMTLIPWIDGQTVFTPGEEGPDLTRQPMVVTTGCFVTPGASLIGEAGRATGGGFNTQVLENECWVSVTLEKLGGSIASWRAGDRVFMPRRGWFSISYLDSSATLRPNIHLIAAHDIAWGMGSPNSTVVPSMQNQLYFDARGQRFYRAYDTTNTGWAVI